MVRTKGATDLRPGKCNRQSYTVEQKAERKLDRNRKGNKSITLFFQSPGHQNGNVGNQNSNALSDRADINVEMQEDAEEGIEEYPIVVTISDMHTGGVAIDRSSIQSNLDTNEKDMQDGNNKEGDNMSKEKSASKSREDGVQKNYTKAVHN